MNFEAFYAQIRGTLAQQRDICQVRVTPDATPGLGAVSSVFGSTGALEIVIHPDDWVKLLANPGAIDAYRCGEPDRVFGIPVQYE